nr:unnamed protein product [Digitaria exilis]
MGGAMIVCWAQTSVGRSSAAAQRRLGEGDRAQRVRVAPGFLRREATTQTSSFSHAQRCLRRESQRGPLRPSAGSPLVARLPAAAAAALLPRSSGLGRRSARAWIDLY